MRQVPLPSSRSSIGAFNHSLISRSTRRSTMRRATDFRSWSSAVNRSSGISRHQRVGVNQAKHPVHFLDRVHRPACGTIAVGIVLEVSLKDWFQHELGRGLDYAIPDGRNAERSLAPVSGSSHAAPDRAGTSSRSVPHASLPASSPHPTFRSPRRYIHPCPVHLHWRRPTHRHGGGYLRDRNLVVEQIEAEGRLRLRLAIQLSLKAPDRSRCCQAHRQSPHLAIFESTPEVRVLCSAGIARLNTPAALSNSRHDHRLSRC